MIDLFRTCTFLSSSCPYKHNAPRSRGLILCVYYGGMTRKLKETYEKWGLDMNLNKTKYLCIGRTHNNLKLDKDNEIEFCQEYKYLGVIFILVEQTTKKSDQE